MQQVYRGTTGTQSAVSWNDNWAGTTPILLLLPLIFTVEYLCWLVASNTVSPRHTVMLLAGLQLHYAPLPASAANDWRAATALATHTAPDIRLKAVKLLSALAKQWADQATAVSVANQREVDAVFITLCSVVSNDVVAAIRVEALSGLAELHHASYAVKQQALNKRATLRIAANAAAPQHPGRTAAAAPASCTAAASAAADGGLLDSATGAFVHAVEDDTAQVRIAAVAAMLSLGSKDPLFADEAAMLLVDLVSDELLQVRLVALQGLVHWAIVHQQQRQAVKRQKLAAQQLAHQQLATRQGIAGDQMETPSAPPAPQQRQQHGQVSMPHAQAGAAGQQQHQQHVERSKGTAELMVDATVTQPQQQHAETQQVDTDDDEQEEDEEYYEKPAGKSPSKLASEQQQQCEQQQHDPAKTAAAQQQSSSSASKAGKKPMKKKRKADLPSWGTDAQAAAVNALRDRQAAVRNEALRLLQLLPAGNMPAILNVLQGLISCCERFGEQHKVAAVDVIRQLVQQRTVLVAKSSQNLCKLLAAAIKATAAAAWQQGQTGGEVRPAAVPTHTSLDLLSEVIVGTVSLKPQMLPSLYMHLDKQGIRHAAALQQLLTQLDLARQQQQAACCLGPAPL